MPRHSLLYTVHDRYRLVYDKLTNPSLTLSELAKKYKVSKDSIEHNICRFMSEVHPDFKPVDRKGKPTDHYRKGSID